MAAVMEFKRKIPDNMNPWTCEVNGVKYVYEAGTEQNVPEEVAHIIDGWYANKQTDFPNTAISFNELRDKPFGEDTEVLFDQTVKFVNEQLTTSGALPISVGDQVKVTFNGVEYELIAKEFPVDPTLVCFGNNAVFGGEDNGIPFAVVTGTMGGEELISIMALGHDTASIKIEGMKVKTIDPKFLPSGTGGGGVVLYHIDWEAMMAVDENGTPISYEQAVEDCMSVVFVDADRYTQYFRPVNIWHDSRTVYFDIASSGGTELQQIYAGGMPK